MIEEESKETVDVFNTKSSKKKRGHEKEAND